MVLRHKPEPRYWEVICASCHEKAWTRVEDWGVEDKPDYVEVTKCCGEPVDNCWSVSNCRQCVVCKLWFHLDEFADEDDRLICIYCKEAEILAQEEAT